MRIRPLSVSFRLKVMLLAVLLVAIQLGTVFPLLNSIYGAQRAQAEQQAMLAGESFSQYMQARTSNLTGAAEVMSKDFGLFEAVSSGDRAEIEDSLSNLASRGEFQNAAVFDISGRYLGGLGAARALADSNTVAHFAADPGTSESFHSSARHDGRLIETISLPIRIPIASPEATQWLTVGFPLDAELAADVATLIGHEASFLEFGLGRRDVFATTLSDRAERSALSGVYLGGDTEAGAPVWGNEYLTLLTPVFTESDGAYVALQMPVADAMGSYFTLRNFFLIVTGIALLATVAAAYWLSHMVTSPIGRLVDAARRMADGIYNQPISIDSSDEFSVLANGFNTMQEAIANREQDIVHMAHHDSLSGLPTREIVIGEIRDAIAESEQLAVVNFVLHRFDELAGSLGHRTADRLIQRVAGLLRDQLGEGHILGHLNTQEFVLVVPDASPNDAAVYVHELQSKLRSGLSVDGANLSLQVRAGVALYPLHGVNASELLRCAGIARGQASHHLGAYGIYEPGQEQESLQRIRIVGDFPRALQDRELWVSYQPKIDCQSLELSGAEALVRWDHPELGELPPDMFIEAIEQAGGISQLTRWVLEEAASQMAAWQTQGLRIPMSVNVSTHDLIDDYLPDYLDGLCQRFSLDARNLTLEVTESTIMLDVDHSLEIISAIRRLGCRVAIDDFGTGHSALAQLKRLPVDELKIDKSFVLNIEDQRDEAVVRTAIELAHKFGLHAVAEGVEDDATLVRLQQLGCETVQGFYISRPLRGDDFANWARNWAAGDGADIVTLVAPRGQARPA